MMVALYADVSNHDRRRRGRPLDWSAIADSGLGLVMCAKASEGDPAGSSWYHDPWFAEMQDGAAAAGYTVRGGYHVLVAGDDASIARQVDALRARLDAHGCVWGMVDVEPFGYLLSAGIAPRWTDVLRFAERWVKVDQRVLAFYVPQWVWSKPQAQGGLGRADLTKLPGPLVASNYPNAAGSTPADRYVGAGGDGGPGWTPYGGRVPDLWQFTAQASVPGASERTDLNAFRGSETALAALLDPTGGHMATERLLPHSTVRQINGYYCGPAAVHIALTTFGIYVSQDELARKLGTTTAGTNSVNDVDRVMDALVHPGQEDYSPVFVWGNDVTAAEAAAFKANIVRSIDAGYGVVVNVVKTGRDVDGNAYTYNGGHYVAVVGYRKGGDEMLVADPAIGRDYWMRTDVLDTWMAARGYVWASHAPAPRPLEPAKIEPGALYPLPAGHYYGDIAGPTESHGGYYETERGVVAAIQLRVIELGHVPGIQPGTPEAKAWADGKFEQPTIDAVKRFQRAAGLVDDGKVGPVTWSALFPAAPAEPEQPSQPEQPAEPEQPSQPAEPPATVDLAQLLAEVHAAVLRVEAKVDALAITHTTETELEVAEGDLQGALRVAAAEVLLAYTQGGAAVLATIAGGGE